MNTDWVFCIVLLYFLTLLCMIVGVCRLPGPGTVAGQALAEDAPV